MLAVESVYSVLACVLGVRTQSVTEQDKDRPKGQPPTKKECLLSGIAQIRASILAGLNSLAYISHH